jgi:hypothetical protein
MPKGNRLLWLGFAILVLVLASGTLGYAEPQSETVDAEVVLSLEVGSEPGQVGIKPGGFEVYPIGPKSFAVGDEGIIYILDTVNLRIQGFDTEGELRTLIPLPTMVTPADLVVANSDTFYVLDMGIDKVFQVDGLGRIVASYEISADIMDGISGITLEKDGDLSAIVDAAMRYKLVANSKYVPHAEQRNLKERGLTTPKSENVYQARNPNWKDGGLQVMRKDGQILLDIPITVKHLLGSVVFLGTDRRGNIYVAIEELLEDFPVTVEKTVRKYDPSGQLLGTARVPIERYYAHPRRDVVVDMTGNIYQLVPTEDRVKILKLLPSPNFASSLDRGFALELPSIRLTSSVHAACGDPISRATVMSKALEYINDTWYCNYNNYYGPDCPGRERPSYIQVYNQWVQRVPYKWGGFDSVSEFKSKMSDNYAAGDVACDIVRSCAAGVDCSGYVSRCWELCTKHSTCELDNASVSSRREKTTELIEGDIINRCGTHVVLFRYYTSEGGITGVRAFEATIDYGGKTLGIFRPWSFFNGYSGYKYNNIDGDSVTVEDPNIHPDYGGGMCDSAWYRFLNNRGHYAYLTLNTNDPAEFTNWADWRPNLPQSGNWEVEAYIADHGPINWECPPLYIPSDTSDACYTIYHADGPSSASRNQAPLVNQWLYLGTYHFNAGTSGWVKLTDLNGEANWSRTVSFSAMRFTLVVEFPQPAIRVSDNETEIDVGETDWVKFRVTNSGTEHTSSWGIQVKVGDGLELVQHSSYPWDQEMCNDRAVEW